MKQSLLLFSALLLAASSGLAIAQPAPPVPDTSMDAPPPPPPPDGAGPDRGPPPSPPSRADARGPAGRPARLADRGPLPPPPPPGGPGGPGPDGRGPVPPPPSPGAHFHIERGGNVVDVKCADDQPMQACATIAEQLLAEGRKL
jgi:hypothetical protein